MSGRNSRFVWNQFRDHGRCFGCQGGVDLAGTRACEKAIRIRSQVKGKENGPRRVSEVAGLVNHLPSDKEEGGKGDKGGTSPSLVLFHN